MDGALFLHTFIDICVCAFVCTYVSCYASDTLTYSVDILIFFLMVSVKCLWENKIEKEGHPLLQ